MSPLWQAIGLDPDSWSTRRPSMPRGPSPKGCAQKVKPSNIRTTVISPGAVAAELPNSVTEPDVAERLQRFHAEIAIPADLFARAVAFAISQPEDVDVNEILFRPTRQELSSSAG